MQDFTSSSYFKAPKLDSVSTTQKYEPPKFFKTPAELDDPTVKALQSQKDNLQKRLLNVGVNPDNPDEIDQRNLIERTLNLTPDQGVLMDIIEVIERPLQAVKGGITGGVEGAIKGFTGEKKMTGVEFLEETGLVTDANNLSGFHKFLANVGTDIALDPFTYIAPVKLLRKTGILSKKSYESVKKGFNILDKEVGDALEQGIQVGKDGKKFIETASATDPLKKLKREVWSKEDLLKNYDEVKDATGERFFRKKGIDETKLRGAGLEERDVRNSLFSMFQNKLKGFSDNIIIVNNNVNDSLFDIGVFMKKQLKNGDEIYVSVRNLEVKKMFKAGTKSRPARAAAKSFTLNTSGKKLKFAFQKGKEWSPELTKKFEDIFNNFNFNYADGTNRSLKDLLEDFIKTGKKGSEAFTDTEFQQFADLMRQVWKDTFDADYILGISDGGLVAYAPDEIFQKALVEPRIARGRTASRVRSLAYAGSNFVADLPLTELTDLTDNLVDDLFKEGFEETVVQTVQQGLVARMFDSKLFKENKILSEPIRLAKRAYYAIGYRVNAKLGTSKAFQSSLRRIGGRQAQKMHEYTTRIMRIQKDLLAKNGKAGNLVYELAEATQSLVKSSDGILVRGGKVELINRKLALGQTLDEAQTLLSQGQRAVLPEIFDDVTAKNIADQINNKIAYTGVEVDVIRKGGFSELVILDGEVEDLRAALANIEGLNQTELAFGKAKLSDEAKTFYLNNFNEIDELLKTQDDMAAFLVKELGYENLPDALKNKVGYVRHYMTETAKKGLGSKIPFANANWIQAGTDTLKKRSFLGTAEEFNSAMKELYSLDFDVLGTDAFVAVEDLVRVTMTKLEQSDTLNLIMKESFGGETPMIQAIENTREAFADLGPEFVALEGGFKGEFSNMYKNLSEGAQKALDENLKMLGLTPDKGLVMHRAAYDIMKRTNRAYLELPNVVKGYDKFLNFWKGVTLVSPGFHLRNLFGNMFNQYAAGMDLVSIGKYNRIASDELIKFKSLSDRVLKGEVLSAADNQIYNSVRKYFQEGVSQTRKGIRDLEKLRDAVITAKGADKARLIQEYNRLLEINFNVAERMDDVQRYALYRWGLETQTKDITAQLQKSGATKEMIERVQRDKAAEVVENALFDYTSLTSFEKEYMKRIFPFYTFMKNNFVFQLKSLFNNPKAYARLGRAYNYWNEDVAGIPTDQMPDYMQDNMWLPIPMRVTKDDKDAIAYLKLNLTPSDFAELVDNPLKRGVESLAAPIKIPLEIGMGVDTFTGRPLKEFQGQTKKMERGVGALAFLRDERGNLAVFNNPITRKVMDDIGLRVPKNYLSITLDLADSIMGYQSGGEFLTDLSQRFSLTGTQTEESLALTQLYQDLEYLRNLRSLYEQETGEKLPSLD
jgi:hypothetical protein